VRLALIGPRGVGKSTVARLLAESLECPLFEADREAERRIGASIAELVARKGWPAFRAVETEVLRDALAAHADALVFDAGGGVVTSEENRALLARFDRVVYLHGPPEELVRRIGFDNSSRPRLTDAEDPLEEMRAVLRERDPWYRQCADQVVDIAGLTSLEVATRIADGLRGEST
jgi:shikimate kinase